MHKIPTKKSIFVLLSYVWITQSLTTITSERNVVPQTNTMDKFQNDAEKLLPENVKFLIAEYVLDNIYKVRTIYRHPSRQFTEQMKDFDALPEPTYPYKAVTSYGESCYNTVEVTNIYIQGRDCEVVVRDPLANYGPLKGYSRTAITKPCSNPHKHSNPHRLKMLFKYVLELVGQDYTRTPGVIVEVEQPEASILQRAGLYPVQSK